MDRYKSWIGNSLKNSRFSLLSFFFFTKFTVQRDWIIRFGVYVSLHFRVDFLKRNGKQLFYDLFTYVDAIGRTQKSLSSLKTQSSAARVYANFPVYLYTS